MEIMCKIRLSLYKYRYRRNLKRIKFLRVKNEYSKEMWRINNGNKDYQECKKIIDRIEQLNEKLYGSYNQRLDEQEKELLKGYFQLIDRLLFNMLTRYPLIKGQKNNYGD